jgi:hypothetical protein
MVIDCPLERSAAGINKIVGNGGRNSESEELCRGVERGSADGGNKSLETHQWIIFALKVTGIIIGGVCRRRKEDQRKFVILLVSPILLSLLRFVMMEQHRYRHPLKQLIMLSTRLTGVLRETQ